MYSEHFIILLFTSLTSAIQLGDHCDTNYHCGYITNAQCQNNVCKCLEGATQFNDECLEDVSPKKSCLNSDECKLSIPKTDCIEGFCKCVNDHHFRDGKCYKNKYRYDYCQDDKECYAGLGFIGSMVCKNSYCVCNAGYEFERGRCRNGSNTLFPGFFTLLIILLPKMIN